LFNEERVCGERISSAVAASLRVRYSYNDAVVHEDLVSCDVEAILPISTYSYIHEPGIDFSDPSRYG
jgi:hypothetical protein